MFVLVNDVVGADGELHAAELTRIRAGSFVGFPVFSDVVFSAEAFTADVTVEEFLSCVGVSVADQVFFAAERSDAVRAFKWSFACRRSITKLPSRCQQIRI